MKLLVFIGLWFLGAVLSAGIAASKGRERQGRLIGGVLIGPFGLLIGLLPACWCRRSQNRPISRSVIFLCENCSGLRRVTLTSPRETV